MSDASHQKAVVKILAFAFGAGGAGAAAGTLQGLPPTCKAEKVGQDLLPRRLWWWVKSLKDLCVCVCVWR